MGDIIIVGANHARNAHQFVTGVEGHPLLAAYGNDAVGQHVGHGHGDRAGQAVALPCRTLAVGGAVAAVAGVQAQVTAAQRVVDQMLSFVTQNL